MSVRVPRLFLCVNTCVLGLACRVTWREPRKPGRKHARRKHSVNVNQEPDGARGHTGTHERETRPAGSGGTPEQHCECQSNTVNATREETWQDFRGSVRASRRRRLGVFTMPGFDPTPSELKSLQSAACAYRCVLRSRAPRSHTNHWRRSRRRCSLYRAWSTWSLDNVRSDLSAVLPVECDYMPLETRCGPTVTVTNSPPRTVAPPRSRPHFKSFLKCAQVGRLRRVRGDQVDLAALGDPARRRGAPSSAAALTFRRIAHLRCASSGRWPARLARTPPHSVQAHATASTAPSRFCTCS